MKHSVNLGQIPGESLVILRISGVTRLAKEARRWAALHKSTHTHTHTHTHTPYNCRHSCSAYAHILTPNSITNNPFSSHTYIIHTLTSLLFYPPDTLITSLTQLCS